MLGSIWQYVYTSFLRYWLKWLVRQATGTCELQRICSGCEPGATRTARAEYSLQSSKNKVLRGALESSKDSLEKCVDQIMKEKNIKPQKRPPVQGEPARLPAADNRIQQLVFICRRFKKGSVQLRQPRTRGHAFKALGLVDANSGAGVQSNEAVGDIGFQGDDPKTDFRGMGLLGLINLVFFSENYTAEARQVLSHANHPKLGYSYAIVGINLTEMAYSLLKSGALKPHFYNSVQGAPELRDFHQLYCYLAYEFDRFWVAEEPESIMHFNQYRERFHSLVKTRLQEPDVSLSLTAASR